MPYLTMPPLPSAHNTSHKPDRREMFTGCGFRVVRDAGIFGVGFQIEVFDSSPHKQARNQMQGDASTGGGLVAPNHATGSVAARTQEVHRWPVLGAHGKGLDMTIRFWTDSRECPHYNNNACRTCDFDRYYASNYPECPWGSEH